MIVLRSVVIYLTDILKYHLIQDCGDRKCWTVEEELFTGKGIEE